MAKTKYHWTVWVVWIICCLTIVPYVAMYVYFELIYPYTLAGKIEQHKKDYNL